MAHTKKLCISRGLSLRRDQFLGTCWYIGRTGWRTCACGVSHSRWACGVPAVSSDFSMLSTVVGTVALLPATIAYITRKQVPLPVTLILVQIAAAGFAVALAASDRFATRSTFLLGKNSKTGYIAYWAWPLFWPYHLSVQAKLWIQRQTRTEAVWNRVDEGW